MVLLFGVILLLVWRMGFAWYWLGVLSLLFWGLVWLASHRPRLVHLACMSDDWQFLLQTYRGEALWQGRLLCAYDYQIAVVLECMMDAPMPEKMRFVVWCDMLDEEAFVRLKGLVRFCD